LQDKHYKCNWDRTRTWLEW